MRKQLYNMSDIRSLTSRRCIHYALCILRVYVSAELFTDAQHALMQYGSPSEHLKLAPLAPDLEPQIVSTSTEI